MTIKCISESEVLNKWEIIDITRRLQYRHQIQWLESNGWEFEIVRRAPVVRREFAQTALAKM